MQLRLLSMMIRVFAWASLVAWALRFSWAAYPVVTGDFGLAIEAFLAEELKQSSITSAADIAMLREAISSELVNDLLAALTWCIVGFALVILSVRNFLGRAAVWLAASSAVFLVGWLSQPAFSSVGFFRGMQTKIVVADSSSEIVALIVFDLLLPLTFLLALALIAYRIAK